MSNSNNENNNDQRFLTRNFTCYFRCHHCHISWKVSRISSGHRFAFCRNCSRMTLGFSVVSDVEKQILFLILPKSQYYFNFFYRNELKHEISLHLLDHLLFEIEVRVMGMDDSNIIFFFNER